MVTIKDVSKRAKVSVATVSRVLNSKGVKKETVEHVLKVMKELNYQPNQVARSLSKRKSKTIALIIPANNNPFFPDLSKSIESEAYKCGYKVLFCNSGDNKEKLIDYIDSLASNHIDGIIVNSHILQKEDVNKIINREIPIVTIDRSYFEDEITYVSVKNKKGAEIATRHLLEVGCQRIGHLKGPENEFTGMQRLWGYRTIVKDSAWFDQSWVASGDFTVAGGYQGMKELFMKHPDIDGVFAANDLSAIGAIKAAYEWKRRIPDDLSIVGFDGIDMTQYMIPSITTIKQPVLEIGSIAMKELIKLIENPEEKTKKFELDVHLIQRESTLR